MRGESTSKQLSFACKQFLIKTLLTLTVYSRVPRHRNWQMETAARNLAGFLHFFKKPAGSTLGSFLVIYRSFSRIKSFQQTENLVKINIKSFEKT